jgi:hypothetical protein
MAMYLLLTAAAIFGWGAFSFSPAYMQLRFLISILAVIAFYLLFSHDLKRLFNELFSKNIERIKQVTSPTQESALPPKAIPVPTLNPHRVTTAEIVQPPSVTEHTTTLLDRNERSSEDAGVRSVTPSA